MVEGALERIVAEAGAATVHLHARDPETGRPDMDPELFHRFCREVHEQSDTVICITTGGAPTMTPEERMVAVRALKPELASINMGSINFGLFPMMARITPRQSVRVSEFSDPMQGHASPLPPQPCTA